MPHKRTYIAWIFNALLLAALVAISSSYNARQNEIDGLESSMEMLATEMRYQNHVIAQELNSNIRREIESGNPQNAAILPVVNELKMTADSFANHNPAAVNFFVRYADSLYDAFSVTHQLVLDTLDLVNTSTAQRRAHIRLVERGVLHTLKSRTVRILSVPDTLMAIDRQPAVVVQQGQAFVTEIAPLWSASGFHPFEHYAYKTTRGRIEPIDNGNRARLVIPTDTLLPPELLTRRIDYNVTITLPAGYGQQRVLRHTGGFMVERGCN